MHTTEHVPDNDIYFLFPLGVIGFTRVQNLEMFRGFTWKIVFLQSWSMQRDIFHHKGSLDLI